MFAVVCNSGAKVRTFHQPRNPDDVVFVYQKNGRAFTPPFSKYLIM